MSKTDMFINNEDNFVNVKPTLEEVKRLKDQFEKIGNNNHRLFVKALFMYERDINDMETLDKMLDVYYDHDISLLNDLIIEKEWD